MNPAVSHPRSVPQPIAPELSATEWGDRGQPTVVLLHGILGSAEYWHDVAAQLPDHHVIALDLLGFGDSPKPASAAYDYAPHVDAVLATLDAMAVHEPVVLAGHSMGALIALRLAADHPERVSRLILIGMPVFESAAAARQAIGRTRTRRTLVHGPVSYMFCQVWCQALKPISRRLASLYLRTMPAAVARATVEHSWRSYSRSLINIVEHQNVPADLQRVACPMLLAYGDRDQDASVPASWGLPADTRILAVPGDHQLPRLTCPPTWPGSAGDCSGGRCQSRDPRTGVARYPGGFVTVRRTGVCGSGSPDPRRHRVEFRPASGRTGSRGTNRGRVCTTGGAIWGEFSARRSATRVAGRGAGIGQVVPESVSSPGRRTTRFKEPARSC